MSDETKKTIPAWQQAAKDTAPEKQPTTTTETAPEAVTPDAATQTTTAAPQEEDETAQREQISAFLQDAAVKDEPTEKKRAFLLTKNMPAHLIDEILGQTINATELEVAEFQSQMAKQEKMPIVYQTPATHEEPAQAPAPIITYPEFLADAHRSEPLVTPGRVLATTYIASATAALAYAASTFLIKPMTANLTDSRHEFAAHSNSKVDELNERLEKLVSHVPGTKRKDDDSESTDSEPTELFSKDEGTQTDVNAESNKVTILEPTATVKQVEKLGDLQKHLDTILAGAQKEATAVEAREENVKKLRHYLDGLAYGGSGINVWSNTGGQFGWEQTEQQREKEKKEDVIEELKKEIRGVKGVLLSAKRFPAAGRIPPPPTATYSGRRGVDAPA